MKVFGADNQLIQGRILLDTGATGNLVTTEFFKKLKIPKYDHLANIGGVNNSNTKSKFFTKITFKSIYSKYQKTLLFFIIPSISDDIPCDNIPREKFKIPSGLKLADELFHKSSPIDMLIGVGPSLSLLCIGKIKIEPFEDLYLQKTKLGWIMGGGSNFLSTDRLNKCLTTKVDFDLQKFWDIEEIAQENVATKNEIFCEEHFQKTIKRNKDGRYLSPKKFRN